MSAVQSNMYTRLAAQSNPQQNDIPSPPWEAIFLEKHCKSINSQVGQRSKKYQQLFTLIWQAIQDDSIIKNCKKLRQNIALISRMVPAALLKRVSISKNLTELDEGINLRIVYILTDIKNQLKKAYGLPLLGPLQKKLDSIYKELPNDLKSKFEAVIKKCFDICLDKIDIAYFASKHDIDMDTQTAVLSPHLPQESVEDERKRAIYPILSIDGGGIRGIIPATMLVEIEKITGEPIANLFKLIGGTSTGGILTLGLSKPHEDGSGRPKYTARDLLDFYTKDHSQPSHLQIFQKNVKYNPNWPENFSILQKLKHALYNPRYKMPLPVFRNKLDETKLSVALTNVLVTTNEFQEIYSTLCSVGLSGASVIMALARVMLGDRNPSIFSYDSLPKTVHIFTNNGLETVSYSLRDLESAYGR